MPAKQTRYYSSACLISYRDGWRGQVKYRRDNGSWAQKSKVLESKGKKAARAELEAWRNELESDHDRAVTKASLPFRSVSDLVALYIDTLEASGSIEASSVKGYRHGLSHIERDLGDIEFDELTVHQAQGWVNELARRYAASTVRKDANLLKAAYRDAVNRLRVLPYSPVECVKTPKIRYREPNALDPHERGRLLSFLSVAADTPENLAIHLALMTGMREAELCGIRWRHVDFGERVLHVREAIGRGEGGCYVKEPKTGGSRRDLPLSDELIELFHNRKRVVQSLCLELGVPFEPSLFVLGDCEGGFMHPHHLWRQWSALAKSLGLKGRDGKPPAFHDLRHTFATAAIAAGTDIKSVSSILGHANAAMTLNIYAAADAQAKRKAMESISATFIADPRDGEILSLDRKVG